MFEVLLHELYAIQWLVMLDKTKVMHMFYKRKEGKPVMSCAAVRRHGTVTSRLASGTPVQSGYAAGLEEVTIEGQLLGPESCCFKTRHTYTKVITETYCSSI